MKLIKLLKRRPPLAILLLIALLALLPSLAVLQYHWLGEVSKGERELMRSNLQANVAQFCREFDREVKNTYLYFQAADSEPEFATRYQGWLESASHPRLVKEIYQTQSDEDGKYWLLRFKPTIGLFEPCQWPERLAQLRDKLMSERSARESARIMLQTVVRAKGDKKSDKPFEKFIRISLGPIDSEIPALLLPTIAPPPLSDSGRFNLPFPEAYRIVVLDLDYIKSVFLPELTKKYFFADGRIDYDIGVVSRADPQQIIYRSDEAKNISAASDVAGNFFSIQPSEADRNFFTHNSADSKANKRFAVSILQSSVKVMKGDPGEGVKAIFKLNSEGHWQLAVTHRSGSLAEAVAGARRKNLAISFGILLLLGASVGLIVLSSRRAQRLAAQQMEFVAGVSHEFRTPLAVICSAGENLADGVIDNSEQIKRYGGLIRDEGRRLTEMVEQVLEFAGTKGQRRVYDLQPADLKRIIEDALAASRMQLVQGGFTIELQLAALPPVKADATALSRALQNLLGNGMKYSGESRRLRLSAELVKTAQGEEARIEVSDHGIGIPPSEVPRIFEPFYRGRDVIAAQIHGNGLGLSLVKHIIEAHGGRISVASAIKQGTTFTLHLPVVRAEELEPVKEKHEQTNFAH